jgi:hypothetical protein
MKITHEDLERIDQLHEKIDDMIAGEQTFICLNTLCALLAGYCAMHVNEGNVTKQRFISDIVECIDVWQDHFSEQISREQ